MVEGILGDYLVETGKLSKDQLDAVLNQLDQTRVKLGLIAVAQGYMTPQQAEEVNSLQATMNKRFGDIAVEKGYLTDAQVGMLLKSQGDAYLGFVQTLMDADYLSMQEIDDVMDGLAEHLGLQGAQIDEIMTDEVERIVPLLMPKESDRFIQIVSIMVNSMIRLVDRHAYIKEIKVVDCFPAEDLVSQELAGEQGIVDAFSEGSGGLLTAACVFGKEEFETVDEDSLDAAGELLNVTNGLYVSALSTTGKFLELMPPMYDGVEKACEVICQVAVSIKGQTLLYTVG